MKDEKRVFESSHSNKLDGNNLNKDNDDKNLEDSVDKNIDKSQKNTSNSNQSLKKNLDKAKTSLEDDFDKLIDDLDKKEDKLINNIEDKQKVDDVENNYSKSINKDTTTPTKNTESHRNENRVYDNTKEDTRANKKTPTNKQVKAFYLNWWFWLLLVLILLLIWFLKFRAQ